MDNEKEPKDLPDYAKLSTTDYLPMLTKTFNVCIIVFDTLVVFVTTG